jgi:hypothetical protein
MNKLLQSLGFFFFFILCASALAQTGGPEIFLKSIPSGFVTVDMDHDEDGNTYILGNRSGNGVIVKYDSSGNTSPSDVLVIEGFLAVAFDVVGRPSGDPASSGAIYVASASGVRKYPLSTTVAFSASVAQFSDTSLSTITDIAYSSATQKLFLAIQTPGLPPLVQVRNANAQFQEWLVFGRLGSTNASVRSLTVDDQGGVYLVGESGNEANPLTDSWSSYRPAYQSGTIGANTRYLIKVDPQLNNYTAHQPEHYANLFNVTYHNGWIYLMGKSSVEPASALRVQRLDTSLGAVSRQFLISSPDYANILPASPARMRKFGLAADALDNVYLTGYLGSGSTKFFPSGTTTAEFRSVASTGESAFVAKLDSDFKYQWVKTPIQSPLPTMGTALRTAWDAKNSRLWWSGSFQGDAGLTMQEGADASTAKTLPKESSLWQGFAAVFQPNGAFTEVVDFTLDTDYAQNRVRLNGSPIPNPGTPLSLILNSNLTIKTPRTVYQWSNAPVDSEGSRPDFETDDIENKALTIEKADSRYSFINFSVNSVVQDSNATVYSFTLKERTTVKLEWLVEFALQVNSNLSNTASRATVAPGGPPYVSALTSTASGNPQPAVGKHWIKKDSPVVMEINGAVDDLTTRPGLAIRYVPWRYNVTGAAIAAAGKPSGTFPRVEPRQQLREFSMSGPATVTYDWKLQYGVDMTASNLAANPELVVQFEADPPTPSSPETSPQTSTEGSGVAWYDDSTTVLIGAPRTLNLTSGFLELAGWFNGDNHIFSPTEGTFDAKSATPFTAAQIDAGFQPFDYKGKKYLGRKVVLDRPGRVVWNYGTKVIVKSVAIGSYVSFSDAEISDFGLRADQKPTLSTEGSDPPTLNDFIWDEVAKKFFPVRAIKMNLLWPTLGGNLLQVEVTPFWGPANYGHIAGSPAVSLVPQPPASQPRDLVFNRVAYTTADASVDDNKRFTAAKAGLTVLQFTRITPAGRGGTAQNVVELKVVNTKLWNTGLGSTINATIGNKITSTKDKAGLGTGYVFFSNARYNPYVYDRAKFVGDALWNQNDPPGPVIPVNQNPTSSAATNDEFVVLWYDSPALNDHMLWPYAAERYNPVWPTNPGRIVMSSGFGSESVAVNGSDQQVIGPITVNGQTVPAATTYDPARFEQVQIYNQPLRGQPGYNPNEEHALMAPSLRFADVAPRPSAAYAMRENDLNNTAATIAYTSHPYVLVQFRDKADNEFKMKVYQVQRQDLVRYPNGFKTTMKAGEPVIPFYPIGVVSGATLSGSTYAKEGDPKRLTFWKDHKKSAWAVSGDGSFTTYFYYPLMPDFWWPDATKKVGDSVAWLPNTAAARDASSFAINYDRVDQTPAAQGVAYTTTWPLTVPTMKVGETLTFAGGEYAQDNPGNPGLPGVLAWSAGEVVFDNLNPDMREGTDATLNPDGKSFDSYTARMIPALEERTVDLPVLMFPSALRPEGGRTKVQGTTYQFEELSSSLKKRVFYNPLSGKLGIKGLLNDKDIGSSTLTAAPPAVYVLEPNILTPAEYAELKAMDSGENWTKAVDALNQLSRNPNGLSDARIAQANNYTAGLQERSSADRGSARSYQAKGPGLALVTNPGFLDPSVTTLPDVSYVTLAENNDPSLGGAPVVLHIIKVDRRERYRGAVKVVLSNNVFDENIILRHTGDFGGNPKDLVFDWWYRVEDGTDAPPPDAIPAGQTNPWKLFPDPSNQKGEGFSQLKLKGNPQAPELLLADSLWFVRYRHKDEVPSDPVTWQRTPAIPYQWAGAGNSRPGDYRAQLAQGWVKRVLDAVNPYEARIRDFTGDSPATYASMIRQFGQRYEGPVALNPDKDVIENVGLIELYSTILNRARGLSIDLSTPVSTPGITTALMLASTRLADFYMLLGNEAYTDAKDSTIGITMDGPENGAGLAPAVFTFQNQLDTQLAEELALLRGVDDFKARPVYNRLFWNFTKGEGEAAYANTYNISDVNRDGFINEDDAMMLYPQGHGDAWGHYLTAIGGQYRLLNNPFFNWVPRSELYSLQNIVFEVDFLDERKFAQVAAAKAKAGAEIVDLSYRESYVADPESQWQGYIDTNPQRAWGVEGWARRAGQGAYFDWITANALLPSVHPNSSYTGIRKVDRTTVKDIAVVSAQMSAIQQTFDDANNGYNPLGIAGNTVPFDIDPALLAGNTGTTHFEQIYDRATKALDNANFVFNNATQIQNMLRGKENDEIEFRRSVFEQDMAYRNELIEIFGTPYSGTIGSGAAYPPGYSGPDTALYMYVDQQVREITVATVPGITTSFDSEIKGIAGQDFKSFINAEFRANYAPSFSANNPADWFNNFNGVNYITTTSNGITFDTANSRVGLANMKLPIKASGYTFEAPASWGQRSSPGQLQLHIAAMIQQEAELAKAIAAWDGFQGGVVRQLRLISAQLDADSNIRGLMGGKIANNTILGATIVGLKGTASALDVFAEGTPEVVKSVGEFVPKNLPTAGFSFSPGDALSALRGATYTASNAAKLVLKFGVALANGVADLSELTKDLIDMGLDFEIDDQERKLALKQALVELENMVGDEAILRVEIYRQQEALRAMSDEYRALLQKGARLMDEREAYNKRVAELVQRNRYSDMSFRVSRNAALQRYQEAFDLAAKYTYLAAKAYDYETNLNVNDPGSAQRILTDIVKERNTGFVFYGTPQQGYGGLSDKLATMKANFDVLKGQLGINNPQAETGRFSLRSELFRIAPHPGEAEPPSPESDAAWRDTLASKKVANLWDMPEFRRYCRPFSAYDPAVPEPGLVIDFSSEIIAGKNFFGQALAGGDNAYDPTNYSTKISSVGAWFEGYLSEGFSTGMSQTPRIYLVPVGSDVMMYPNNNNLSVRLWNVLDQKIPVPFPATGSNLANSAWRPLDTLGGTQGEIRRFSSFRAYPDSGYFTESEMTFDTRLVGRSVWNTRWLLIIPGRTLRADAGPALDTFIDNVTDIKLFFQTYGMSGN